MPATITDSHFDSHGTDCAGKLFLPQTDDRPPVVVMGHGLGAQQDFRLPAFAERFVECGLAVFTFDYRHWGESAGEPRQLLIPNKQKQDWHAALAHVRGLAQVDGERLAIWGSSFGGAHVIHVAAEDHDIKAVVSQVLAADTASAVKGFGLAYMLKSTALGVTDALRGLLGMKPLYFPLVGKPGENAVMNTPECWEGYLGLVPQETTWQNHVTARSLLLLPMYRAIKVAHRVTAPTLLMGGVHDSLVPIDDIRAMATLMPRADLREYDCNHFEPYYAPMFETFVSEQAQFLVEQLQPALPAG
jgi:dipeptidyl aminopeptidase/acylaminoacyl peptidase